MPVDDQAANAQHLRDFIDELEKIRFDIRKSAALNKSSDKYIRNLEKLIKTSKEIVSGNGTKGDTKKFEKLVRTTDMSLRVMRKKNRDDELYQDELTKIFGDIKGSQDASVGIFKKIHSSMKKMTDSISILSDASAKDAEDTGLGFLTGAFGAMAKETVGAERISDVGGILKGKVTGLFGGGGEDLKGQAHDGMTNIPSEGTYNLDAGERVIAPEQNKDLSAFLDNSGGGGLGTSNFLKKIEENTEILTGDKPLEVFNKDHNPDYFSKIIDNDDRLHNEDENMANKRHKETKVKFEILGDIMSAIQGSWLANFVLGIHIWSRRFARHPILNTMGLVLKSVGGLIKGFAGFTGISSLLGGIGKFLFGNEAKKDTDRIVQANEDIIDAVRGEAQKDRRGIFKKGKSALFNKIGSSFKSVGKGIISGKVNPTIGGKGIFRKVALPQKRDAKGRFAKRDKSEIIIDSIKEISKSLFTLVGLNDDILDESKKKKGNKGLLGKIFGGSLLAKMFGGMFKGGKGLLGKMFGGMFKGGKGLLGKMFKGMFKGGKGLLGKLLVGGKSFAKFGGSLVKMVGVGLFTGLKTVGLKIFSVVGSKMFGMLGLALGAGGLIGTYLVKPLIDWIDNTFGTSIIASIGGLMASIIAGLEELPLIGGLIKKMTGGVSDLSVAPSNEEITAQETETAQYRNVADRIKSGDLQRGSDENKSLIKQIQDGDYKIVPVDKVEPFKPIDIGGVVKNVVKNISDKVESFKPIDVGGVVKNISDKVESFKPIDMGGVVKSISDKVESFKPIDVGGGVKNVARNISDKVASFKPIDMGGVVKSISDKVDSLRQTDMSKVIPIDKSKIPVQIVEQKISEATQYMKQQTQSVTNNVVNNTQKVIKSLPSVDDLGSYAVGMGL